MDEELEVFGQSPGLNIYTQISLCYPLHSLAQLESTLIDGLKDGLERLTASFPWLAGQVVGEGASEGTTGVFKIKPLERQPRLVVKDLRRDSSIPNMGDMQQAKFPFTMLDESFLAPIKTLPNPQDVASGSPTFLIQATFITGGLLLTFLGQHQAMDMTGFAQAICLFSKACKNESFTSAELATGNMARHDAIPLLEEHEQAKINIDHQVMPSEQQQPTPEGPTTGLPSETIPTCSWVYLLFAPSSLSAMKAQATSTATVPFVSTDDVLSAFIWQHTTLARLPRLQPKSKTTFARAIDPRRFLDLPPTYPGLIQNMTYHTYTASDLANESLGAIASNFRQAIDPRTSTLALDTRALATALSRAADKNTISVTASLNLSTDIMLSSWAKEEKLHSLDFGMQLGQPEAVRRPAFDPVESLMYFMPKTLDGEIVVAVCLRQDDLERLRVDEEVRRYARWIG